MYDKIDHLRSQSNNEQNKYLKNPNLIPRAIDEYLADRDNKFRGIEHPEVKIFSKKFFYELQFFDLPRPEPDNPELAKELLPEFNRRMLLRKEAAINKHKKERAQLAGTHSDFRLRRVDEISLKMHLGAKEKVPVTEVGAITTPGSLRLAHLQAVGHFKPENKRT